MFVDAVVFMYAFGADSPWQAPCRRFLRDAAIGRVSAVASAEVLQELLHRYRAIGRQNQLQTVFEAVTRSMREVVPVSAADVEEARHLGDNLSAVEGVSARDLLHAAVARRRGISTIVSYDRGFDGIPGITRVEPQ